MLVSMKELIESNTSWRGKTTEPNTKNVNAALKMHMGMGLKAVNYP